MLSQFFFFFKESFQRRLADNLSTSRQPSLSVKTVWSGQEQAGGVMQAVGSWRCFVKSFH